MMLSALTFSMLGGCQQQEPDYIEVKRVHEQLTKSEVRDYLKIIYSLPTRKVPPFPSAYAKPAEWEPTRTLSVHDLVLEEEKYIENIWNEEVLVRQLSRNKPLMKRLKRARMTPQQFIGFTRTIGMAMSRGSLRENQNLREILEEGEDYVLQLPLPHVELNKVKMTKRGDELFISIGNFKRELLLPNVLAQRSAGNAIFNNGMLQVRFPPNPVGASA